MGGGGDRGRGLRVKGAWPGSLSPGGSQKLPQKDLGFEPAYVLPMPYLSFLICKMGIIMIPLQFL